jgi:branched-chain amino acid transport system permease protein
VRATSIACRAASISYVGGRKSGRAQQQEQVRVLQFVLSGVSIGAIYGLLGLALALSFYVTRVINFAQGQMLTVAIVVAASLAEAGYNPWIGVALGPIAAGAIGVVSYFVAVRPILKADRFSFGWMVSTLGFGLALENAIAYIVGPRSRAFPPLLNDIGVHIGGVLLTAQQILAIAVAAVIIVALELVRRRTLFGKVGMAAASDPEMAECIGANTMMVAAVTFAVSGLLAGLAGVLIAPRTFANPYLGGTFNTFGFVSMMIGGAENPAFAMAGGVLLGVLAEGANTYINSQASDWFPFVILVLVLLVSPKGIFSLRAAPLAQLPLLIKQIPLSLQRTRERITGRSIKRSIPLGPADETWPLSTNSLAARLTRYALAVVIVIAYLVATYFVAWADLQVQGLILVAAIYAILAICLDATAGVLGLYSLGVGGFFAIGAYLTTILSTIYGVNLFLLIPIVIVTTGLLGVILGAASLRVSGLHFAITTFIFTLVITVLATDLQITNGMQGLLGPNFPDLPDSLAPLGSPIAWCVMLTLLVVTFVVWSVRRSLLYPVLLAIRDAEPFAEAAGVRPGPVKILIFALASATIGFAGWLFCFLGVVSPSQFSWSVSLNVLIMILIGGINTTPGPIIGAAFVSMFPVLVHINPWLQQVLYGLLSILVVTMVPEGAVGVAKRAWRRLQPTLSKGVRPPAALETAMAREAEGAVERDSLVRLFPGAPSARTDRAVSGPSAAIVECRDITFRYGTGPTVLSHVNVEVAAGHIHGLIGPNGSGKSTLANIIAGRLRPISGSILIKERRVDGFGPADRARLGLRRSFQAAQLIKELVTRQNVLVGAYGLAANVGLRSVVWPLLPSARRDMDRMSDRALCALCAVGAGSWTDRRIRDVPHGIEQLTQLASVCVASPDIIILDEPATGLTSREIGHLAWILRELKGRGLTMIVIEHQTRFLFRLCDLVTVLNAGEIVLTGTADEVRSDPVVRKVYLGE